LKLNDLHEKFNKLNQNLNVPEIQLPVASGKSNPILDADLLNIQQQYRDQCLNKVSGVLLTLENELGRLSNERLDQERLQGFKNQQHFYKSQIDSLKQQLDINGDSNNEIRESLTSEMTVLEDSLGVNQITITNLENKIAKQSAENDGFREAMVKNLYSPGYANTLIRDTMKNILNQYETAISEHEKLLNDQNAIMGTLKTREQKSSFDAMNQSLNAIKSDNHAKAVDLYSESYKGYLNYQCDSYHRHVQTLQRQLEHALETDDIGLIKSLTAELNNII
jgi:hypothetical protein